MRGWTVPPATRTPRSLIVYSSAASWMLSDAGRRHDHAQLVGELFAQDADALQQVAALRLVDQRHQRVADLQLERLDRQQLAQRRSAGGGGGGRDGFGGGGATRAAPARDGPGHAARGHRQGEEGHGRQAGHEGEEPEQAAGGPDRPRAAGELGDQRGRDGAAAGTVGHQQAGRGADDQRRDLRHQAVADGQRAVGGQRLGRRHAVLRHADDEAADQVDEGDDQAGDGVAAHELGRAVHGPVEVGVAADLLAPAARLVLVDEAGAEVGVNAHLPAGHRIEGEARRHLGDAPGALGDDHEVDHHQDEEEHQPDHVVAADDEVAEGGDHLTGVAAAEDQAGARDVEPEPEQRQQQQQGREDVELERIARGQRDQQHDDGQRQRQRQESVEHERRQRHDQQRDDHDHADRQPGLGGGRERQPPPPERPGAGGGAGRRARRGGGAGHGRRGAGEGNDAHARLPAARGAPPWRRARRR